MGSQCCAQAVLRVAAGRPVHTCRGQAEAGAQGMEDQCPGAHLQHVAVQLPDRAGQQRLPRLGLVPVRQQVVVEVHRVAAGQEDEHLESAPGSLSLLPQQARQGDQPQLGRHLGAHRSAIAGLDEICVLQAASGSSCSSACSQALTAQPLHVQIRAASCKPTSGTSCSSAQTPIGCRTCGCGLPAAGAGMHRPAEACRGAAAARLHLHHMLLQLRRDAAEVRPGLGPGDVQVWLLLPRLLALKLAQPAPSSH